MTLLDGQEQSSVEVIEPKHDPVMMAEIREVLSVRPGCVLVDATLGLAGHASDLLARATPGATFVGFDWDASMLAIATERLQARNGRDETGNSLHFIHSDYRGLEEELAQLGLRADAILMDLGLNSAQIEDPSRGIAFKTEGPLDMRMDRSRGEPASALLNRLSPLEIERMLWDYGDERWAKAIAKHIVERRKSQPLRTTTDLVDAVLAAVPAGARDKRIHPATRTFQAVRIVVNRELDGLEEAIRGAARSLAPEGRLAVLSYHSGEDRATKVVFREMAEDGFEELTRKPRTPSPEEIARNPRSRSAKLRVLRRLPAE